MLSWFCWYKETVEVIAVSHTRACTHTLAHAHAHTLAHTHQFQHCYPDSQLVLYQNKIQWAKHQRGRLCVTFGIRCSSAGGYQTALHCCGIGGELPVFVVRHHAPNREVRTVTVRYEYMYRATPNIYIYNMDGWMDRYIWSWFERVIGQ